MSSIPASAMPHAKTTEAEEKKASLTKRAKTQAKAVGDARRESRGQGDQGGEEQSEDGSRGRRSGPRRRRGRDRGTAGEEARQKARDAQARGQEDAAQGIIFAGGRVRVATLPATGEVVMRVLSVAMMIMLGAGTAARADGGSRSSRKMRARRIDEGGWHQAEIRGSQAWRGAARQAISDGVAHAGRLPRPDRLAHGNRIEEIAFRRRRLRVFPDSWRPVAIVVVAPHRSVRARLRALRP